MFELRRPARSKIFPYTPLLRTARGRTAALQFLAEVVEEALPEGAPEDAVFRLVLAGLDEMQGGRVWMPGTYFALWMSRVMGWRAGVGHCVVCGLDLGGGGGWDSAES